MERWYGFRKQDIGEVEWGWLAPRMALPPQLGWFGTPYAFRVTDPYQPIERRLNVTRSLLEVLCEAKQAVSIITKKCLVTRMSTCLHLWRFTVQPAFA